jgi:hypothetical protein
MMRRRGADQRIRSTVDRYRETNAPWQGSPPFRPRGAARYSSSIRPLLSMSIMIGLYYYYTCPMHVHTFISFSWNHFLWEKNWETFSVYIFLYK